MLGFAFCDSTFEPNPFVNGSWAIPEASECAQRTDFRLVPALFLLLTAPILIYRSQFGRDTRGTTHQLSRLVYFKILISLLILTNGVVLSFADLYSGVPFFFPLAFIISLFVSVGLTLQCRRKGVFSSGVLFSYYALLALCSLPEFRYSIEKLVYAGESGPRFYFTVPFVPLVLLQTILYCFSDYNWSIPLDPKKSPELKTSFVNQQLFGWISDLVVKGYKCPLVQSDVYAVNDKDLCQNVVHEFLRRYNSGDAPKPRLPRGDDYERILPAEEKKAPKSVLWPILMAQKWTGLVMMIVTFGHMAEFLVPVFLGKLLEFVGDMDQPAWVGLAWAICIFLSAELLSLTVRAFYYRMHVFEMNISSTLTSVIYAKALRLSNEARRGRTAGEIVNLMSVDVDNFKDFMENSMYVLLTPPTIVVGVVMLYNILGVATFVGFAMLLILIAPASYLVSKMSGAIEDERMETRDERVKMVNEILNGIKVVKMHAWEESMKLVVEKLRDKELGMMAKLSYLQAFLYSCYGCIDLFVTGSAFGFYVLIDPVNNVLTPQVAFVALSLFSILYNPILELPFIFSSAIRFAVSNKRIKSFLAEEELEDYIDKEVSPEGIISLKNASFYWEKGARMTLRDVTMAVRSGELVAVVGEVGCGKSSLVAALLGEMTKESGSVAVAGSVAYVPQQAWIQNATLRNNVLFGRPFDERFYDSVLEACALKPDLEMLQAGDATEIGERVIHNSWTTVTPVPSCRAST
uniref:ABC transmembrane type-1 domain-containing protein n=2 Tax=Steinernema glaseri TaxID=37863 RepID=A0A1I7YAY3_9BILA